LYTFLFHYHAFPISDFLLHKENEVGKLPES
jgi:hypothetical protein